MWLINTHLRVCVRTCVCFFLNAGFYCQQENKRYKVLNFFEDIKILLTKWHDILRTLRYSKKKNLINIWGLKSLVFDIYINCVSIYIDKFLRTKKDFKNYIHIKISPAKRYWVFQRGLLNLSIKRIIMRLRHFYLCDI